ncbi:hypothetical protein [Wansuia hejianensis]|uniref:Uncharacterized protein n=1 Tax=Wansuia hejianensis TaxID=2763667 RepID=A0A926F2C5_9FIRM|nr:hypothetical protein [Wansuia hejianensis]MBC8590634.1 hypothetical protein [Wansuia hejianensis]
MTIDEIINQLDSLRMHCEEWTKKEDIDWIRNVMALDFAIMIINRELIGLGILEVE